MKLIQWWKNRHRHEWKCKGSPTIAVFCKCVTCGHERTIPGG